MSRKEYPGLPEDIKVVLFACLDRDVVDAENSGRENNHRCQGAFNRIIDFYDKPKPPTRRSQRTPYEPIGAKGLRL